METPMKDKDWENYLIKLKEVIRYAEIGCCPGCGITPEALDEVIKSNRQEAVESYKDELIREVEGTIGLSMGRLDEPTIYTRDSLGRLMAEDSYIKKLDIISLIKSK